MSGTINSTSFFFQKAPIIAIGLRIKIPMKSIRAARSPPSRLPIYFLGRGLQRSDTGYRRLLKCFVLSAVIDSGLAHSRIDSRVLSSMFTTAKPGRFGFSGLGKFAQDAFDKVGRESGRLGRPGNSSLQLISGEEGRGTASGGRRTTADPAGQSLSPIYELLDAIDSSFQENVILFERGCS